MLRHRAFTLIEILVVVILLGILAAVVIPQYAGASTNAAASSLRSSLHTIQTQVYYQFQRSSTAAYPAAISANWFTGNLLPQHPENSYGVAAIETISDASLTHPVNKMLTTGAPGAFWYNSANGIVRARVADKGSASSTLNFYNLVNASQEASLGAYGGGGGS